MKEILKVSQSFPFFKKAITVHMVEVSDVMRNVQRKALLPELSENNIDYVILNYYVLNFIFNFFYINLAFTKKWNSNWHIKRFKNIFFNFFVSFFNIIYQKYRCYI